MKFCQHCGAQLSEGTRFCESCGARVEEEGTIEVSSSNGGNAGGPINTTGITKRNIVVAIILSIITCGIYDIYWMIKLNNELLQMSGKEGPSGGMVFFLTLITCGIYGYIWFYKMGECVDVINNKKSDLSTGLIFILLAIFGFGFVNYILAQNAINEHVSE